MSHRPRDHHNAEQEAILISLDQLAQTLEVMTRVVNRLKHQMYEQYSPGNRRRRATDQQAEAMH